MPFEFPHSVSAGEGFVGGATAAEIMGTLYVFKIYRHFNTHVLLS